MKRILFLSIIAVFMLSCATPSELQYPPVRWLKDTDNRVEPKPKVDVRVAKKDQKTDQTTDQVRELLAFSEEIAATPKDLSFGGRIEALNVNNFDEVADSTWFTNRLGRTGIFTDLFKTPPYLKKKLKVLASREGQEATQLLVKDAKNNNYVIRMDNDPNGLDSGTEIIGSLFLANAGFNVTENYIVTLDNTMLDKKVLKKGEHRALAIRIPGGEQIGHFPFIDKRSQDKNDRIPHEHKRELRGLRLFAAFLNDHQIGTDNTLDIYENGYVTHYLTNLKAPLANMRSEFVSGAPKRRHHTIDALFSFGLYNPYWASADIPLERKGDVISSSDFDPKKWQPKKMNTAFKYMTARDAFWAARILSRLNDANMKKLVDAARYHDPELAKRIMNELKVRRDKIVRYYFGVLPPFDDISLKDKGDEVVLSFTDLTPSIGTEYRYRLRDLSGHETLLEWTIIGSNDIALSKDIVGMIKNGTLYKLQLQLKRPDQKWWSPSVAVFIEKSPVLAIKGIERTRYH